MTQITFRDNKFWIDWMEIVNTDLLSLDDHSISEGDTFPIHENLSYESEEEQIPCPDKMPGCAVYHFKKVIRLKLKDNRCPTCGLSKDTELNYCSNSFHLPLKNETPEAVVKKPDFEEYFEMNKMTFRGTSSGDYLHADEFFSFCNSRLVPLQNENEELKLRNQKLIIAATDSIEWLRLKISDLEAQLVKAMEMIKCSEIMAIAFDKTLNQLANDGVAIEGFTESWQAVLNFNKLRVKNAIGSFLSINEVKE